MDEDYIEIIEPVRLAGSVALSSQNGQNLGHTHGPLKDEGTKLEIQTTIKKTVIEGNVEERDTSEAESTDKERAKKGDRLILDGEKDNNNEYK